MDNKLPPLVVMGVSGCGKSTIGGMLGERLGIPFADGDDYHPTANKAKMANGIPLEDEDRLPWLAEIGRALADGSAIIACSALKRRYRDLLRSYAPGLVFVYLSGDPAVLSERINGRSHEYMPSSLLQSQLATLEAPESDEAFIAVDISAEPDVIVDQLVVRLAGN
ncbi:gluconokinase [Arthrobacter sp. CJ23]|uniref:gluconokinase n=1 Tax=Arthrobacter sp. CJ23 TaxID=2972479 RepID=UPI00215BD69D|nr:gluconokinase [Arthrobacter sp. CJ23]UVJ40267.1 gluconokinase [Arthrobacter sp. CJ23]